ELADLTMTFYKRNYIEGLFLSSGVIKNPDYTMELIIKTISILRNEYGFNGYIHAKVIPGASNELVESLGLLADRLSVNIEMPSAQSLERLAPQKSKAAVLAPMGLIQQKNQQATQELAIYRHAPKFAAAGQSTQMIIGASDESDLHILKLTQGLYDKYKLKRVFYSAYIPINSDKMLPDIGTKPPLLREHRLYQADWLLRFYGFKAEEILDSENDMFNPYLDPKCNWAINNMQLFPCEINTAEYSMLLRVPGIGVRCAKRIVCARRAAYLDFDGLKKIGVVLKRAQFFITCKGKTAPYVTIDKENVQRRLIGAYPTDEGLKGVEQLSLFSPQLTREDVQKCITGQM
ncbi:MAG: putative DNA modification/repair radical SAM protein, partial [Oscillospiraceae bacterium]